jgi:hypothetical protein
MIRAMAEGAERAWMGMASASMPGSFGSPPAPARNAPTKKRRSKARRPPRPR